jgi:transcriptional regulator with PAS, ATPase and Fis domain
MTLWDMPLRGFLQRVAQAVATVLHFDVTIVDSALTRIAGTGKYAALVGQPVAPSSSFAKAMRTGKPYMIMNPRQDPVCGDCEAEGHCVETCHMAYPLLLDSNALGVLGLIGFFEEQRQRMVDHTDEYMAFVEHIARLVESTAKNVYMAQELERSRDQLRGIVEAVKEGIIAVDNDGIVICCNQAASELLAIPKSDLIGRHLQDMLPGAPILRVIGSRKGYSDREVTVSSPSGPVQYVSAGSVLCGGGQTVGAVELLKTVKEARRFAYHIADGQPDRPIDHILGKSHALRQAKRLALRTAMSSSTVLLTGESGTGKELFARAIHYHSSRGSGPFVAVNCAAIPEDLLESELFGYEEGAFTGARKGGKPGKFELADSGTLFLDEVADCSLRLQAKLLRVLDCGEIQRIGGTRTYSPDVRILAATNRDLEGMVRQGEFREDLYFRLSVVPVHVPPLRAREGDIVPLFNHFLHKYSEAMQRVPPAPSEEAERILLDYHWPGNIRELENAAQYVLHTCPNGIIRPRHLPPKLLRGAYVSIHGFGAQQDLDASLTGFTGSHAIPSSSEWERAAIEEGLRRLGDTPRAKEILAEQLGLSRSTIYRRIREYGLG